MESTRLRVGDVTIHATGSGAAPPIVLLHANGGDCRDFDALVPGLASSRTVYAVDWPAHGDSSMIQGPTACGFAQLLPSILQGLGPGPFILLGNSVGGFAALRAAIDRPDLVSGLVLVNPGGFTPRTPLTLAVCHLVGNERLAPAMMRWLPRLYLRRSNEQVQAIQARASTASRVPERVGAFASLWRSFAEREHDARVGVGALAVPTLLVWGTQDPVLPWGIDGRRAARALPRATVARLRCGHQAFAEMPGEFLSVLEGFLQSLAGQSR